MEGADGGATGACGESDADAGQLGGRAGRPGSRAQTSDIRIGGNVRRTSVGAIGSAAATATHTKPTSNKKKMSTTLDDRA